MRCLLDTAVKEASAYVGTVGVRSKSVFVGAPLSQLSFDLNNVDVGNELPVKVWNEDRSADFVGLGRDERTLAYSTSNTVKLFDVHTGREARTLIGHDGRVNQVAQSNRSIYVWATASSDCIVKLWDIRQHPADVQTRRFDFPVNCAMFSPDDHFIAVGSDQLYIMESRFKTFHALPRSSQVLHVSFHPTDYLLAVYYEDHLVRFWDMESEECVSTSAPTDGLLKSMVFHPRADTLFTLTDRRCEAIRWEPCEVLSRFKLSSCDRSLAAVADDFSLYVLARSPNKLVLLTGSYSELLSGDVDPKEETYELEAAEIPDAVEEETPPPLDSTEFAVEKEAEESTSAFMPTRTLARTPPPQPFTIPSSEETFVVTLVPPNSRPARRPNTLKTRFPEMSRNGTKVPVVANCARRVGAVAPKTAAVPQMPCASSVPAINPINAARQNFQRKKPEEKSVVASSSGTETAVEEKVIEEITRGHANMSTLLEQRKSCLESLQTCWRNRGVEAAITDAARSGDVSLLAELLSVLNHSPAMWNLTLCSSLLTHVSCLISSKHESYVECGLTALRTIISGFGSAIRAGATQPVSSIGVDVNAEERREKCSRCMRQLTEMRATATLLNSNMSTRHAREFDALMQIFDDTMS